ncbi:MAG: protein kinase [Cyanobacteria bacterium HKST-UBA02]|nr:protein kinase [Cyanobacteria bacterium HKST-UBA02]
MSQTVIADRYELICEIGAGAVGVVYKVLDRNLKKTCALKTIKREPDDRQLLRFQSEAKAISALRHGNVVEILDFGLDADNKPFLVMELIEGENLFDLLQRQGPPEEEEAIEILIQVADAMDYTHKHGILHRDLKASNIMLVESKEGGSPELRVKILDFGLAKDLGSEDAGLTNKGQAIGTAAYMSPEHARGGKLDERSDIYSLGCIIYELLTGSPPFHGDSPMQTIEQQLNARAPALKRAGTDQDFSPDLEKVVARALEKDPARRFATMAEVRDALIQCRDGKQIREPDGETTETIPRQLNSRVVTIFMVLLGVTVFGAAFIMLARYGASDEELAVDSISSPPPDSALAGSWSPFPWEDGISWQKRFEIEDQDLREIAREGTKKYVSIWGEEDITLNGFAYLEQLQPLGLAMGELPQMDASWLQFMSRKMKSLEVLYFPENDQLNDDFLVYLKDLPHLRFLALTECSISDQGLQELAAIKTLDTLKIDEIKGLTGDGLRFLIPLTSLHRLCLQEVRLSKQAFQHLAGMNQLRVLDLEETGTTDEDLKTIATLPLTRLDLSKTPVTATGLAYLDVMKDLQVLRIYDCKKLAPQAVEHFKSTHPHCKIIKIKSRSSHVHFLLLPDEDLDRESIIDPDKNSGSK